MAEQSADDLKGNIFIDEAHPNRMSELMGCEVREMLMAISDLATRRPFIELPTKCGLKVGLRAYPKTCETMKAKTSGGAKYATNPAMESQ